jgi:2-hydroxy-3-oxopropionate reductase
MGQKIAFIGMGIMGLPMAGHLLAAGHSLTVHSRTKGKAEPILAKGAAWAESAADAARSAEVVFVCVTDTPDVEVVVLGECGALAGAKSGTIIVDHSTISPAATRRMADASAKRGVAILDAPVSGGDVGARNATLSIMVGGDSAAFEKVKPLLACMGKNIVHCGASGTGQLTKLVNQALVSVTNLAVCEALTFAARSGLDLEKTIAAVAGGAAGSWQLANLGPKMLKHDFAPGFMIDLMQKDLRLLLQSAGESGTCLPASGLVHQLFTSAQAAGHGRSGTQALYSVIEKLAGS